MLKIGDVHSAVLRIRISAHEHILLSGVDAMTHAVEILRRPGVIASPGFLDALPQHAHSFFQRIHIAVPSGWEWPVMLGVGDDQGYLSITLLDGQGNLLHSGILPRDLLGWGLFLRPDVISERALANALEERWRPQPLPRSRRVHGRFPPLSFQRLLPACCFLHRRPLSTQRLLRRRRQRWLMHDVVHSGSEGQEIRPRGHRAGRAVRLGGRRGGRGARRWRPSLRPRLVPLSGGPAGRRSGRAVGAPGRRS